MRDQKGCKIKGTRPDRLGPEPSPVCGLQRKKGRDFDEKKNAKRERGGNSGEQ